jgi:hypothetical protein
VARRTISEVKPQLLHIPSWYVASLSTGIPLPYYYFQFYFIWNIPIRHGKNWPWQTTIYTRNNPRQQWNRKAKWFRFVAIFVGQLVLFSSIPFHILCHRTVQFLLCVFSLITRRFICKDARCFPPLSGLPLRGSTFLRPVITLLPPTQEYSDPGFLVTKKDKSPQLTTLLSSGSIVIPIFLQMSRFCC